MNKKIQKDKNISKGSSIATLPGNLLKLKKAAMRKIKNEFSNLILVIDKLQMKDVLTKIDTRFLFYLPVNYNVTYCFFYYNSLFSLAISVLCTTLHA